ncbi:MAG TPA: FAA hydrolase family protein [Nannocystis exedens]|nr:FAA hydrolase family protein [Nannocystis exedens]
MESASSPHIWLARARDHKGRSCVLRILTEGQQPGPDAEFEEIADPFADPSGDPWRLARDAVARVDGFCGRLDAAQLEVPLRPSKILGVGRNYRAHAAELGNEVPKEPLLFLKPPSCLVVSGAAVSLPRGFERIDLEAELVVVIGRRARSVTAAMAWQHIAGYALGNDISCRDLQRRDGQWTRAKGFDGFGPLSALVHLTPPGFVLDTASCRLRSFLDDVPCQDATVDAMIFGIPELIEVISACMTLDPGDLIFTGTPKGVAPICSGQVVRIIAEGPFAIAPVLSPLI